MIIIFFTDNVVHHSIALVHVPYTPDSYTTLYLNRCVLWAQRPRPGPIYSVVYESGPYSIPYSEYTIYILSIVYSIVYYSYIVQL